VYEVSPGLGRCRALIGFGPRRIFGGMPVKLLRQILTLLIATAYIDATLLQAAPGYAANAGMNHAAMSSMTHDQDHPGDKMPCKGMLPGCLSDLGCIFLVSLSAPDLTLIGVMAWSSVSYGNASQGLHGRTIKPALGPPIPFA
jgi:hypothetical protein